ncbi:MAG TPA: hypothetical protein VL326_19370 [Kofleriaceae bacterium]|jgi:hypothetical protein|nr:hypothetical protein [Kofleriaceae bacterium]
MADDARIAHELHKRFSFVHGPFVDVGRRLHLTRRDQTPRAWALVAIAWCPLAVSALISICLGHEPDRLLRDVSLHARLLVALPILILGDRVLARRCHMAVERLYGEDIVDPAALDPIISRAERMRDLRAALLVMVVVALAIGQLTLWRFGGAGIVTARGSHFEVSFARIWYTLIALPMVNLLLLHWLWQWTIWSYVVIKVARLELRLVATHPDGAGGIGFVAAPINPFALSLAGVMTVLSSSWANQILLGTETLQSFIPGFVVVVLFSFAFACGPFLAYVPVLANLRVTHALRYSELALHYTQGFHAKWVEAGPRKTSELLGTADIQSLNDLIGAYGSLVTTRVVPVNKTKLLALAAALVVPVLPLSIVTMSIDEVLMRLGKMLLGLRG